MSDQVRRLTDRVLHVAKTFDPTTRLPLVVIDSTGLPEPQSDLYTQLVDSVIGRLPNSPYALLFFACGAPNKPSWSWVAKTYAMLERHTKKQVRRLYIVHESWWVRACIEMLSGVVSHKFKSKIVHISSLTQLAEKVDITLINIHPLVYLHNLKVEDFITVPRHHDPIFGVNIPQGQDGFRLPAVWNDAINYLRITAPVSRGVFKRTEYPDMLYILKDCYDRGQLLDLDDYGSCMAASVLKLFMYELPTPVLPVQCIRQPMEDSASYCTEVFGGLPEVSQLMLIELVSIMHSVANNTTRTHQTATSLGQSVGPSLAGQQLSKDNVNMAVRYTKNLIEYWPRVFATVETKDSLAFSHNRHASLSIKREKQPPPPPLPRRGLSISEKAKPQVAATPSQPPPGQAQGLYMGRNNSSPELRNHEDYELPPTPQSPLFGASPTMHTDMPPPPAPNFEPGSRSSSSSSSTWRSVSGDIVTDMPPPPPQPKPAVPKKSSSKVLQPSNKQPEAAPSSSAPASPVPEQKRTFGPKSKTVASTGRGKMVAELARLYEDKSQSAQILVDLERYKKKGTLQT